MNIAYDTKDKIMLMDEYQKIRENGNIKKSDKILYLRGKYVVYDYIYKLYVKFIKEIN